MGDATYFPFRHRRPRRVVAAIALLCSSQTAPEPMLHDEHAPFMLCQHAATSSVGVEASRQSSGLTLVRGRPSSRWDMLGQLRDVLTLDEYLKLLNASINSIA